MIEQTLRYRCDYCEAIQEATYRVDLFSQVLRPCPPPGWRLLGDTLICAAHQIDVRPSPAGAA
jgi:hypothetical protein